MPCPELPVDVWHLILKPDHNIVCSDGHPDDRERREIVRRFLPTSPYYDRLRLVNRSFNSIVSAHVFREITTHIVYDPSLRKLKEVASSAHLKIHLNKYVCAFWDRREVPGIYEYPFQDIFNQLATAEKTLPGDDGRHQLIIELFTSTKLYDDHIRYLPLYPNLTSLEIWTSELCLSKAVPKAHTRLGIMAFRAFLQVCYLRTLLSEEYSRIHSFKVYGLDGQCLILPVGEIHRARLGMVDMHEIDISLNHAEPMPRSWIAVLGSLIRAATGLDTLRLTSEARNIEEEEFELDPGIVLRQPSDVFTLITTKTTPTAPSTLDTLAPPVYHFWRKLRSLELFRFRLQTEHLMVFLRNHKETLTQASFHYCTISEPLQAKSRSPWVEVFLDCLKSINEADVGKVNIEFKLYRLSAGTDGHEHMYDDEAQMWQDLLNGKTARQPRDGDFIGDTTWCDQCREGFEVDGDAMDGDYESEYYNHMS